MCDHLGKLARESHSNCANQQALNLDTACAHLNENLLEFGEVFNKFTCLNNKKQTFEKLKFHKHRVLGFSVARQLLGLG